MIYRAKSDTCEAHWQVQFPTPIVVYKLSYIVRTVIYVSSMAWVQVITPGFWQVMILAPTLQDAGVTKSSLTDNAVSHLLIWPLYTYWCLYLQTSKNGVTGYSSLATCCRYHSYVRICIEQVMNTKRGDWILTTTQANKSTIFLNCIGQVFDTIRNWILIAN